MSSIPYQYLVFTDASLKKTEHSEHCGYAVAVINLETYKYTVFNGYLADKTIAYGEAWAIYRGIQEVAQLAQSKLKKKKVGALIITDSKLCVNIFTQYIPKMWDLSDWNDWKTKGGKSVKNQEVFRKTLKVMKQNPRLKVRLAHMHGHITDKNAGKIKDDLSRYGIEVNGDTVKLVLKMNRIVDEEAKSVVDRQIALEEVFGPLMTI